MITNKIVIDETVFARFPKIRYVGVNATGYNVVDLEAARRRSIIVTNIPAYSTDSVVQFTWALILEMTSKVSLHNESVKKGDWIRSESFCYWLSPIVELAGKTIGIYGFGNIGRGVAKAAQAFGMNVLVCTKHPEKYSSYVTEGTAGECGDGTRGALHFCPQDRLFRESDVLSFHTPLTEETEGLVNESTLSLMKPGAFLVNVSRGGVVVDEDLARALAEEKLAGAALDVISKEPMEADSPLYGVPNLILTPHIAWATREARERLIRIAAENAAQFLQGTPQNVVN